MGTAQSKPNHTKQQHRTKPPELLQQQASKQQEGLSRPQLITWDCHADINLSHTARVLRVQQHNAATAQASHGTDGQHVTP
jgi:hypothetical protein